MLSNVPSQLAGENRPQPIFEQTVGSKIRCSIYHTSIAPNPTGEHHNPHIKIMIPFEGAEFEAIWHDRSGQRQRQQVRTGHVCVLPANLPHQAIVKRKHEGMIIDFAPEFIDRIATESIGKSVEIVEQWAACDPLIHQLGIDLRQDLEHQPPRSLYIESVIQVLANHLVRHYSANPVTIADSTTKLAPQQLQQAIDYIHKRLTLGVKLSDLANEVKMSQYRFARAFKQSTGLPPHQYLLSQRIELAQRLLANKELPIGEIGYQLGFANQSHFTATFRRFTTVTPNLYRQSIGASF
jgi:AraC family transcriptional regulator